MTDSGTDEAYFRRLVDEAALEAYLADELGPADDFAVERHTEGHSNETLFLTWGGRELVLRRPPPGETAETAHDVLREYRVLDALQGTGVPVPGTVLACDDHAIVGSDFYLMDRVRGDVLRDDEPDRWATPAHRRRVGEELVDTLAAVHAVDYEAVGLGEFGHPPGYTERQVDRWGMQLMWAFEVTADEREVPALYDVGEWLSDNVPDEHHHTLVHGDYKLDNVMFAAADGSDDGGGDADDGAAAEDDRGADETAAVESDAAASDAAPPELVAVMDWEMSTLGDPLADLGWMLSYWRDPKDPEPSVPELTATFMEREGYPSRRELVERYEERTGYSFENDRFYRALAVYKLCGLGEMFYRRYLEGNSDDPMYPLMDERVPALADRAMRIIEGDEPL